MERKQQPAQHTGREQQGTEDLKISLPNTERPEGPFEHSGETSNWTAEEKEEKAMRRDNER